MKSFEIDWILVATDMQIVAKSVQTECNIKKIKTKRNKKRRLLSGNGPEKDVTQCYHERLLFDYWARKGKSFNGDTSSSI